MTIKVFGHRSPDTDSTGSPLIWAAYFFSSFAIYLKSAYGVIFMENLGIAHSPTVFSHPGAERNSFRLWYRQPEGQSVGDWNFGRYETDVLLGPRRDRVDLDHAATEVERHDRRVGASWRLSATPP